MFPTDQVVTCGASVSSKFSMSACIRFRLRTCLSRGASESRLLSFSVTFDHFGHFRFHFHFSVHATAFLSINQSICGASFYCVAQRHTMGYVWETLSCARTYWLGCVGSQEVQGSIPSRRVRAAGPWETLRVGNRVNPVDIINKYSSDTMVRSSGCADFYLKAADGFWLVAECGSL